MKIMIILCQLNMLRVELNYNKNLYVIFLITRFVTDKKENMNQNMLIVTDSWRNTRTFKMIPVNKECPYNECIFDPANKVLAIVSKEHKENVHMLPVLDSFGRVNRDLPRTLREQGLEYKQERLMMDTYYEYFIRDKEEIQNFVNTFGVNSSSYSFQDILETSFSIKEEQES